MPALRELQRVVMRALLDGESNPASGFIAAQGVSAAQALGVHANNARGNFVESLVLSYPAIRRLVGEDYCRQCARGFHARHPSQSGDLQPAGAGFAQYLFDLHGADEYRYLSEVARLEWLIQAALLAADHAPLDMTKLQRVAPGDYDGLRFGLHPSARLFASQFPCVAIWEANVAGDEEPEIIDLGAGPDRVLLIRGGGQLRFHRLSHGEWAFLQSMQAGAAFVAAVASGAEEDERAAMHGERDNPDGFDAAAALQRFVLAGVIVDCR